MFRNTYPYSFELGLDAEFHCYWLLHSTWGPLGGCTASGPIQTWTHGMFTSNPFPPDSCAKIMRCLVQSWRYSTESRNHDPVILLVASQCSELLQFSKRYGNAYQYAGICFYIHHFCRGYRLPTSLCPTRFRRSRFVGFGSLLCMLPWLWLLHVWHQGSPQCRGDSDGAL